MMDRIIEKYGEEYILRQLAEECSELAQASLKMIRAQRRETPVLPLDARDKFLEELADVQIVIRAAKELLSSDEEMKLLTICREKENRWYRRMLGVSVDSPKLEYEVNEK